MPKYVGKNKKKSQLAKIMKGRDEPIELANSGGKVMFNDLTSRKPQVVQNLVHPGH